MRLEVTIIVLGRLLQMGIMAATLRVMTAFLPPDQVGLVGLFTSVASVFVWFLNSPVSIYVTRHTYGWWLERSLGRNYLRFSLYILAVSVTAVPLVALGYRFLPAGTLFTLPVLLVIALYVFASTLGPAIPAALNILNHRTSFVALQLMTQILCLSLSFAAVRIHSQGAWWLMGQVAGFVIGGTISIWFLAAAANASPGGREPEPPHPWRGIRAVAAFGAPLALVGGFYWLQFLGYRVVINNLMSLSFLGFFFAGYSVSAGLIGAVETIASQLVQPYFYRHIELAPIERRFDLWLVYSSAIYPMMVVIGGAGALFAVPISHILLAPKFWAAAPYIAVGALVESCRLMATTAGMACQISKRTYLLLLPHVLGSLSMVALVVLGARFVGAASIGPAMIAAALVFVTSMLIMTSRHTHRTPRPTGWWVIPIAIAALALVSRTESIAIRFGVMGDLVVLALGGAVITGAGAAVFSSTRTAYRGLPKADA